jgi:hypothetical protein
LQVYLRLLLLFALLKPAPIISSLIPFLSFLFSPSSFFFPLSSLLSLHPPPSHLSLISSSLLHPSNTDSFKFRVHSFSPSFYFLNLPPLCLLFPLSSFLYLLHLLFPFLSPSSPPLPLLSLISSLLPRPLHTDSLTTLPPILIVGCGIFKISTC